MSAAKETHGLYVERTNIERASAPRARTLAESARVDELNAQMRVVYDAAWKDAMSARNVDSFTGAPLRRADSGSNTRGGNLSQALEYGNPPPVPNETGMPSTSSNSASPNDVGIINSAESVFTGASKVIVSDPESAAATRADLAPVSESLASAVRALAEMRAAGDLDVAARAARLDPTAGNLLVGLAETVGDPRRATALFDRIAEGLSVGGKPRGAGDIVESTRTLTEADLTQTPAPAKPSVDAHQAMTAERALAVDENAPNMPVRVDDVGKRPIPPEVQFQSKRDR